MRKFEGRYLCWDEKLIDKSKNLQVQMHKPEKKNIALLCDDVWEGVHNGYATVVKTPNGYLMYYRAAHGLMVVDDKKDRNTSIICVAESKDGINFTKPILNIHEYNGNTENNIVLLADERWGRDTFSVMYDENPDCPDDERFKALTDYWDWDTHTPLLMYMASPDGFHFTEKYVIDVHGTMDSYNSLFWDKATGQYYVYFRSFHNKEGDEFSNWEGVADDDIRDVRVATSKDFVHFTPDTRLKFADGEDYELYTNQVMKYYRDEKTFIGMPSRYIDRCATPESFKYMNLYGYRQKVIEKYGRGGTALTDCILMTSEDGVSFNRRDEAFLTPGPENRANWWYGNCYPAYGIIETPADEAGAPNEMSIYMGETYRIKPLNYRRYTLRLDGFFSWFAPYKGANVLTKTFKATDSKMFINFSTSARGSVTVTVCDKDGNALDGYKSYLIFGDAVKRPVEFEKPLADLKGQTVRLKFEFNDAHIYSFEFEEN